MDHARSRVVQAASGNSRGSQLRSRGLGLSVYYALTPLHETDDSRPLSLRARLCSQPIHSATQPSTTDSDSSALNISGRTLASHPRNCPVPRGHPVGPSVLRRSQHKSQSELSDYCVSRVILDVFITMGVLRRGHSGLHGARRSKEQQVSIMIGVLACPL